MTVENVGRYAGKETVQLYVMDVTGSVTRPVKELRGFSQVYLNPGEKKELTFILTEAELGFYNRNLEYIVEPGKFVVMAGPDSKNLKSAKFEIL